MVRKSVRARSAVVFALVAWAALTAGAGDRAALPVRPAEAAGAAEAALAFVPNHGQFAPEVRFEARAGAATFFFTDRELVAVREAGGGLDVERIGITAAGGRPPEAGRRLPGVVHYLRGGPEEWRTSVPRFGAVVYRDAWPGVDLRFAGMGGVLRAEVDATRAADGVVEAARALRGRLASALGAPGAGGARGGAGAPGGGLEGAAGTHGATLAYSTYLGGTFGETARGLAVDAAGHAHVAGTTTSHNFPTQAPFQGGMGNSGRLQDAFVSKIAPGGGALVWSTFLGGARLDEATGVALDEAGNVHLTGYTTSENFPLLKPVQASIHLAADPYSGDGFVSVLAATGDALAFSTFLGGTSRDLPRAIAVDAAGYFYLTGATGSHFPAVNALYPLNRGVRDAFLTKFEPLGGGIVYSTHLGGSDRDEGWAIAADGAGNAYITGFTRSRNFRVTPGPLQRAFGGVQDAFVARINADGSAFDYVTYYGARAADEGVGIAVTPAGEAIVLGRTESTGLPRINALQPAPRGSSDMFLARLNAAGTDLVFSTYLGGNGAEGDCLIPAVDPGLDPEGGKLVPEWVGGVTLDVVGRIYVTGCTASPNFPVLDPLQATLSGDADAFVSALEGDGSAILFSTYLGGNGLDVGRAVAVDPAAAIYAAGGTSSVNFPLLHALQPARSGVEDAFALKIAPVLAVPPTATPPPPPPTPTLEPTPTSEPTRTVGATATQVASTTATASIVASATAVGGVGVVYLPVVWGGGD